MSTGLDAQQKIFAANPDDRRAFEALEEHFFLEGDWDALCALYRARLAAPTVAGDVDRQAPLLLRLGQLLEERVLDLDAAVETYWSLARLDPTHRPALRQLRGIHERRQQWDLVLQIAELEGATPMPPYERAGFESELGRTWLRQLGDREEARRAFERALECDESFPPALEGLAEIHREAGRFEDAAATLRRLAERLRGPERAPVWIALGGLCMGPLEDRERARACFEAALVDDPFQSPAVEWALLLATEREDWEAVSELLESRFDLASGARHRAAIAVEASQIQLNHLGSRPAARAWLERARELAPDEPSVLLATADIERAEGDEAALLRALDALMALPGEKAPRGALVEAATLHAHQGRIAQALTAVRRAANRPGGHDEQVLRLHARLLRESDAKRELAEVLETLTALDGAPVAIRAADLRELAALQEQDLTDAETAVSTWRRAFDLEPDEPKALAALERIHRKQEDWSALRALLETALDASDETRRSGLAARLGQLLLEQGDDVEAARAHFESALALDATNTTALAGLHRVAERCDDAELLLEVCEREAEDCDDADRMAELARAAIPRLRERGDLEGAHAWTVRWTRLAPGERDALVERAGLEAALSLQSDEIDTRRRLARIQSGAEKSDTLRRQAELHRRLGEDVEAATTLELALEATPEALEIRRDLCETWRRLDRPQDLARGLRELADALPAEERCAPLEELAALLEDPIGDLEAAIVVRWRLVEESAAPPEATVRLERLLEIAGRHAELARLLDTRRAALGDETAEAFEIDQRRAALLLDSLGHWEEAAEILRRLHERHPDDEAILDQLERALRAGDDAQGLCDLLEQRAGWTSDATRRVALELERAALLEEALGEPMAACALYERIARESGDEAATRLANERLEALLEGNGCWERLRALLVERLPTLSTDRQLGQRERIASICRDRLQDLAGCAEQLEAIAGLVADRVHVWQQLQEIYAHELDRPADWLRVVEAELEAGPQPAREIGLHVGAARLLLDDARRPAGRDSSEAHPHYERVVALAPAHAEAVEVLAHHYAHTDRPRSVARVLEARIEHLPEPNGPEADAIRLRLGRLYAETLEDDERARLHLEAAHPRLGSTSELAEPLASVYERVGDDAALARLCQNVIDTAESDEAVTAWRVRLAAAERRAGRLDRAAAAYQEVLRRAPNDREIEDALISIHRETGAHDVLVALLEKRLPYASEDESIALRLELAGIHAEGREDEAAALDELMQVVEAHPYRRDALDPAIALAERVGPTKRLLDLLDVALTQPYPAAERARHLERRGELLAGAFDRPEQAVASFREAVSLDRSLEVARRGLRAQLERLERWPAVLDCLFLEASEAEPGARVALLEQAAEIASSRLGPDSSLPWLTRLRKERPEDPELLARIAAVHRQAGRFEAALRALDEQLDRTQDESARFDLELSRARLLERDLHAPGRAILAYQRALELCPGDREPILAELDRLYDLAGRPAARARILEARLEARAQADSDEATIELRQTLASLYCVDLSDPESALPHLLRNVAASRGDVHEELRHLGALDAALRACARHDAWVRAAERQLELVESNEELARRTPEEYRAFLREELARVWDRELGNPDRALAHLTPLADAPLDGVAASRIERRLHDLLRRSGRRIELAKRLGAQLATRDGEPREWLELARLREETLHDLEGARAAFARAEADPALRREAIRGLRRCAERLRDWEGLALALEAGLDDEGDRTERAALARKLGDVCWHRLAQGDRAARAYERALELAPRDRRALRTLIQVEESAGRSERVVALYRRELSLLDASQEDRERRFDVWLRIASVHRADPERRAEAIEAYGEAASIETLPAPDELALARLYAADGDAVRHAETLGRWCDREDSAARIDDHLELARALLAAGDARAALARAERAAEVAPAHAEAWTLVATLTRDAGDAERAADAWERAAEHSPASRGARHLVDAAACLDPSDGERAMALLERAVELDPGLLSGHVALTRVASARSAHARAERSADAALELARAEGLEDDVRLDVAVLGGRAARVLGHREASRRLFACALEIDPDHVEALEGVAAAHFADGDHRAAREILERRIDLAGENPQLAQQLAMIARGLEAEDHLDAAWARYEEALGLEPALEEAHEGLVRVHERASRPEEALAALERWCDEEPEPELLATQAIRAAEHALALEDVERARRNLDRATRAAPHSAEAWSLRCDLAAEHESEDATRRLCAEALESVAPGPIAAKIALRAARLAEAAGRDDEALTRYAESARWDPRCSEAALSESRLVRRAGDWLEADAVLERFLDAHPDPTSPTLAHVHLERGRLLSGPLEDVDRAIEAYEHALALQPELAVARTSLGKLLAHAPDRWREALAVHRTILESSPTTASSLRALAQIAEQRGARELAGAGLAILHALGLASPQEAEAAPARLGFAIHPGPPMDAPESERLRRLAHQLAEELAPVLASLAPDEPTPGEAALAGHEGPIVEAGRVLLGLEDELTARGLSQLPSDDRRALFLSIAALFLDPGGNGGDPRFHDPLDQALGRWTRRKVRRVVEETSIEAIEAIDFEAWGDELRTLAAAQAVDRGAASLRDVLRALVLLNGDAELRPHFDQADLGALAVASEPARRLLIRVTTLLCERLEAGR